MAPKQETQEKRIRLLLVDELLLFRTSLSQFLAAQPGFEVTGECGDAAEALEVLRSGDVDIVLLDFNCGGERAEELITKAKNAGYSGAFLVVTGRAEPREAAGAIKAGASGMFLKSDGSERLIQAIRLIAVGCVWVDPKVIRNMADRLFDLDHLSQVAAPQLTDRERSVLMGVVEGLTNRKIGRKLGLSESAIKGSVQHLFLRAGVRTRSQLVRAALEGQFSEGGNLRPRL